MSIIKNLLSIKKFHKVKLSTINYTKIFHRKSWSQESDTKKFPHLCECYTYYYFCSLKQYNNTRIVYVYYITFNMYDWVDSNLRKPIPSNAVWCSKDVDGSDIYIGRAEYQNAILPVKIASFGNEIHVNNFKVLVNLKRENPVWHPSSNGALPPNAIQCGFNKDGRKLFLGRALHNNVYVPGHVAPHCNCMFYPFGGKEHSTRNYEVLVNTY